MKTAVNEVMKKVGVGVKIEKVRRVGGEGQEGKRDGGGQVREQGANEKCYGEEKVKKIRRNR